jgi:hypothetical protein
LKTLPGSWRWPVEPWLRWVTETPCVARRPPKFQRFMAPWKPLPWLEPVTSTIWPLTKWSAVISAPTSMTLSGLTRNSASLRLGSTLATAKLCRSARVTRLALRLPAPSCSAVYPFFSSVRCASTWTFSSFSTVTGMCSPASVKMRVMPTFCAITPERMFRIPS